MEDKLKEVMYRSRERRLIINRIPTQTKEKFIEMADEEFVSDYGLTLKAILDGYLIYRKFFELVPLRLEKIEEILKDLSKNESGDDLDRIDTKEEKE